MSKLRLGVIGAGSWAVASHLPNLRQRADEVEFVGAARTGTDALARLKERFGFAVVSEDYRDVIAAGIDICVVSSPTALHFEHARAALEAGAHVLIEKPVTIDPADAWALVDLARERERELLVAFGWNYKKLLRDARALMATHGVGTIEHVSIRMSSFTRELLSNTGAYPQASPDSVPEQRTWTDSRMSGGGYAQAQLSHALGAALWLTGLRGEEVFAFMAAPMDAPVELHDAIALRYAGGAIGTIAGTSAHQEIGVPENELQINVVGSEGQLALDIGNGTVFLGRRDAQERIDLGPEGGAYDCVDPPNALVDLALGRGENCSPGELGARTVEILDAAYRSVGTGRAAVVKTKG